jgi:hypothetical protein
VKCLLDCNIIEILVNDIVWCLWDSCGLIFRAIRIMLIHYSVTTFDQIKKGTCLRGLTSTLVIVVWIAVAVSIGVDLVRICVALCVAKYTVYVFTVRTVWFADTVCIISLSIILV